jgi:hypothetical protein
LANSQLLRPRFGLFEFASVFDELLTDDLMRAPEAVLELALV